jgi:hypothetical protein
MLGVAVYGCARLDSSSDYFELRRLLVGRGDVAVTRSRASRRAAWGLSNRAICFVTMVAQIW